MLFNRMLSNLKLRGNPVFHIPRLHTPILVILALLTLLPLEPKASAQQATAQINGTVKDPSGAVVVGAKVTLRNTDTTIAHTVATDHMGAYSFTLVGIGKYELDVEHPGFEKYVQSGITLQINQNAKLDVNLQVGAGNQTVEVSGDVTQVDTITATLGKVETTERILALPLIERDTMQLGLLQAGVFAPDQDDGSGNPFSVSGQRSESMTFLIDGADNNDFLGNNQVVNPNPDAVAEFKILTNNYTAEYGRTSGGIVNQVIKSGTNQIHGSAFDFFRNTALDASDYFLQEVPVLRRNIFGGTIGLPIIKNKMFLFASYQGARRSEGQNPGPITVLSAAERTGNFAELLPQGVQLVNPTTGANYQNNQVPVDPVIANYINDYLPLPNRPGNIFIADPVANIRDNQYIFRFDYNVTQKDLISATYIVDNSPQQYPFVVGSYGGDVPVGSGETDSYQQQAVNVAWTRTITPTLVNEARISFNRSGSLNAVPTNTTTPAQLGFSNVNPDDPHGAAPPPMEVNGAFNLGPNPGGPTSIHDSTYQYQDTISWTHGRHDMKFGGDFRWVEDNFNFDYYNNGSYLFQGDYTGSDLADFVGGFFYNYYQFSNAVYGIRTHSYYVFGQDSWKLTKNLTLSYGLRYEYNAPQTDPHNEIIGWYPGRQSTVYPDAPPNFLYPGDAGTPNKGLIFPDKNNFAPRFGFAWDTFGNSKFVVRGGGGIFYDIEDGALNLQFGGQPPFGYVANIYPSWQGVTPTSNGSFVSDPFTPSGASNPFPFAGKTGTFFDPKIPFAYVVTPHFRTPYAENFNFGFQYQATKSTVVEAVYVGSLSRKSILSAETNYPTQANLTQQYLAGGYYGLNPECARPLAACDVNGNPTGAQEILTNLSEGSSSSNEFQLTVDQRLSHGVQFRLAYTNAKTIDDSSGFRARSSTLTDPTNPAVDRGLADFDAPQRLVLSPIWELPLDKPFHNSIAKKIAAGWSVATIATFQSGNPFTLFSENNSSQLDSYLDRPDVTGPIQKFSNLRQQQTFSPNSNGIQGSCLTGTVTGIFLFNPTNLVCSVGNPIGLPSDPNLTPGGVPLFTHGNMGRNVLRGPGINNWDFSIAKEIKLTESKSIEFRTEFYNAFNHVQFNSPTLQAGAIGDGGQFGQITSDRGSPGQTGDGARIIQFALKIYF